MNGLLPWKEERHLTSFRREMDRLFDRFLEGWPFRFQAGEKVWKPALDVSETAKEVVVKAELPGVDPKDIDLSVRGDILKVAGHRKQEKEEKGENFHRVERTYGSFSRSIQLPAEVDSGKVNATCKDGVLKITLPKTKVAATKKIEVKVA